MNMHIYMYIYTNKHVYAYTCQSVHLASDFYKYVLIILLYVLWRHLVVMLNFAVFLNNTCGVFKNCYKISDYDNKYFSYKKVIYF